MSFRKLFSKLSSLRGSRKYIAEPVKFDADGNVIPQKIDPNA
jgi:hypothetical protein